MAEGALAGFVALLLGALACVLWPLRRRAGVATPLEVPVAANLAAFRFRERELDEWLARGEIDAARHQVLRDEAERLLAQDVAGDAVGAPRPGGRWLLGLAGLAVMALALAGYWRLGAAPDLVLRDALANADSDIDALIDQLRGRAVARPDNVTYGLLLARFEQQRGHLPAALAAYEALLERAPDAPEVRAEYAQALFLAADNQVTDQVRAEAERVLAAQPDNGVALGLRGIGAFQRGAYAEAIAAWQQVLATAPDASEAEAVASALAAARARLGAAAPPPLLRVAVGLEDGAAVDPEMPVFVIVREWQGPPMPVVARRLRAGDLPVELTFETTSSLLPGRPLASVARYEVVARLARSGTPEPGPDDREARAGPFEQAPEGRLVRLNLEP